MTLDLLQEPLIQTDAGWCSLPELLATMAQGEVQAFPALRPHQRPAWHMFLVQLSVMALDAAGRRDIPKDAEGWRTALRLLTPDFPEDEPWHLIGADRSRPAFLQPPDPGGLKWSAVATPDALDMLITSRNHDVKREIAHEAAPQDWIFALVSLQTMEGFGGAGNYGIARMNGGSSSRVLLGLAPTRPGTAVVDPSAWWARDVARLLETRHGVSGKTLLWQTPWPDGRMLDLAQLDPLFIEVCRRIRLVERDGTIGAERSTSKAARIAGKEAKGNTGDPWAPVHLAEGKSLTLGDQDWTHELLVRLLFSKTPEWAPPPLTVLHASEATEPMLLVAEAFARGNSKTDGFKSRIVPVPVAMVSKLFGAEPVAVAEELLEEIASVDLALRNGLALVAAGGDRDKVAKPHYARSQPARALLRRRADELFFPQLWARMAVTTDDGFAPLRRDFLETLSRIARDEFARALPAIPCATLMRPRAEARGRQALERGLRNAMRKLTAEEDSHVDA
ncbi:CRISPR-associated protein Cse1 [Sinirhodobacter ferrireducens]|uniref:CRISPR-associated protein Cse1 n=1 Tax=Paenirhodobacter ferrireducens TaxID=1215032 RepID=A0A443L7X7_9RHOB|nr:CRISPR-associated protein Cse1 [Sinirhodobacter ferrireducens]RWR45274.1 CRISPR-associated protein Cse1 [Sinirhodobacter ferrireducens]